MATTLTFIPLVGLDKIVALRNVNDDDILAQRANPSYPNMPVDAEGRPGTMRVAFRLIQADCSTADDLVLRLGVKCPIPITPGNEENFAKWSPICRIQGLTNPATLVVNPGIGAPVPAGAAAEAALPGLLTLPQEIAIPMSFVTAVGDAVYDIELDWSHTVAS